MRRTPTPEDEQAAHHELQLDTLGRADDAFSHQHVVDAWAAQHADEGTKPMALVFALIGLYLRVEKRFSGRLVQGVHMELARRRRTWPTLPLPDARGDVTVVDVVSAPPGPECERAIDVWCASVWRSYAGARQAIVDLVSEHGIA